MTTESDRHLHAYLETGDESAFAEIVRAHLNLVYATALRRAFGNTEDAKEIAQIVFSDLARNARALSHRLVLAGWLYRHTVFTASKFVRSEKRRKRREQEAMKTHVIYDDRHSDVERLCPLMDDAMTQLNTNISDRNSRCTRDSNPEYDKT